MNWIKKTLADVAGTQEPIYGPEAIQTVTKQAEKKPYTELTPNDLKWEGKQHTNVETQTFYFMTDEGVTCMAQIIYSNVMGVRTTCQFNSKIYDHDGPGKHQWCSDPLDNHGFDEKRTGFFADDVALSLSDDGTTYTIKSAKNQDCICNLTVKRTAPGFMVGENGTSYYGTDPSHPWGEMFHKFWPRAAVSGTMQTKKKTYNVNGRAVFIHALQGMKPHHAAARWNFVNFQTPTYSAVMMEFTTPPSYGKTVVNVGGIAKDGELIYAGCTNTATHLAVTTDPVSQWPEPKALLCKWTGKDGKPVEAELMGDLGERADRVDVLAHVPAIIKNLIGGVVGTKPIIFQYITKDQMTLKVKEGDNETSEKGSLFCEATFIS
ncbi:putative cell survival pathways protein [Lithohypha guttulata]|uniref:putative cell survival pathways protein n=1 Tax=Lithohypha guttulata TaxID=1690604 RepID=UPI002DDED818|nr:putative cell survival pathways protein [Lithohypha guttulata]KAK5103815.1 putative cell survival pathways protein [Lithohypha guttulata]